MPEAAITGFNASLSDGGGASVGWNGQVVGACDTLQFAATTWPQDFTDIQQIVCFLRGTRIAVPGGERPVECLRVGDLVRLAEPAAAPHRIKWIGRRSYSADAVARHRTVHPVIIHQGALAAGVPCRDLAVSPMHAVNIGGVFYPAIALLNGISITRSAPDSTIDYFHIELDTHETILAEGAPVESYRDDGCRFLFDNADSYFDWHGGAVPPAPEAHWRVDGGTLLNIVRSRLAERAGAQLTKGQPGPLVGFVERIEHGVLDGWAIDAARHYRIVTKRHEKTLRLRDPVEREAGRHRVHHPPKSKT